MCSIVPDASLGRAAGAGDAHSDMKPRLPMVAGASDERLRYSCRDRVEGQSAGLAWNRTEISRRGGQLDVKLNGRPIPATSPSKHAGSKGPISIAHEGGVITLANVFVRE